MKYHLSAQYGKGKESLGYRAIKGYYCEPCALYFDEAPKEKPYWRGRHDRSGWIVYACFECGLSLKVCSKPVKEKPDCVCGHTFKEHLNYGRSYLPCRKQEACQCEGYSDGKLPKFKHPAHLYLKQLNETFRGCESNGIWSLIVHSTGYAFFQDKPGECRLEDPPRMQAEKPKSNKAHRTLARMGLAA